LKRQDTFVLHGLHLPQQSGLSFLLKKEHHIKGVAGGSTVSACPIAQDDN
jgi:hypothetical protein